MRWLLVFINTYSSEFDHLQSFEITSLLTENSIYDPDKFVSYDDCFYIKSFPGRAILFEIDTDENNVLLCSEKLEVVTNFDNSTDYEFFYEKGTSDIYRLDTKENSIEKQTYSFEDEVIVASRMSGYKDHLLIYTDYDTSGNWSIVDDALFYIPMNME